MDENSKSKLTTIYRIEKYIARTWVHSSSIPHFKSFLITFKSLIRAKNNFKNKFPWQMRAEYRVRAPASTRIAEKLLLSIYTFFYFNPTAYFCLVLIPHYREKSGDNSSIFNINKSIECWTMKFSYVGIY